MSNIPQAQPVFVDTTTLNVDTPCVICGYNLRGLTVDKVCPECGSPVGRSIHGNMLRYADPKWLGSVLLGVRLTLWYILAIIVLALLASNIARTFSLSWSYLIAPLIAVAALRLVAAFLITTQEPKISLKEDTITLRQVVRVCAVAAFISDCLDPFSGILPENLVMSIMVRVPGLLALVAYFGTFVYLRRFALRIPNKKLARSTKRCMWGFIITMGAGALLGALAVGLAAGAGGGPGGVAIVGVVACGVVAFIVFAIWYLILLFDYRNAFRNALEQSQAFAG